MRVRDALGPLFADTDFTTGVFAEMYSVLGQPGLSPALLTMVMILQHRHNLSDEDAARAVADRIHSSGRAIVWSGHKEVAEHYWQQLHGHGLTMSPLERS